MVNFFKFIATITVLCLVGFLSNLFYDIAQVRPKGPGKFAYTMVTGTIGGLIILILGLIWIAE